MYFIAGAQHGANAQATRTVTQNRANPTDYRFAMRALLIDLNSWVTNGTAPPDSKIPRVGKDELVAPGDLLIEGDRILEVAPQSVPDHARVIDLGDLTLIIWD